MFAGLTREEQEWIRQEAKKERAKRGLAPLPETATEELKLVTAKLTKAWRWVITRMRTYR